MPSWHVTNHPVQHSLLLSMGQGMGTGQESAAVLFGREGNRRPGVALAMRHRLVGCIHLRVNGLRKEIEHSAYAAPRIIASFTFTFKTRILISFMMTETKFVLPRQTGFCLSPWRLIQVAYLLDADKTEVHHFTKSVRHQYAIPTRNSHLTQSRLG